jgi:hypothetical protein
MNPPSDLRDRILAAAARTSVPTRPQANVRAVVGYAFAATAMAIVFLGAGGFEHSHARPLPFTFGIAAGASAIALAATAAAFGRGRAMLGPSPRMQLLVVLFVPLATFAWLVLWHDHYVAPFVRIGFRCFALTVLLASGPLFVTTMLRAGTMMRAVKIGGAAIGAACGAWASVAVDAWCPLTDVRHVALGHALPLVVLTAIGACLGELVLKGKTRAG